MKEPRIMVQPCATFLDALPEPAIAMAAHELTVDLPMGADPELPARTEPGEHNLKERAFAIGRAFQVPLSAWAVHLLIVLATVAVTVWLTPGRDWFRPDESGWQHYTTSPLATWDGAWYAHIANHGYSQREQASAFWPLFPTLMSLGHESTGLSAATVGVLLSNCFFLAALVGLFLWVRGEYGAEIATRAVWIAALSPLAFFFSAAYTESLFLLLTIGAMLLARAGRWTEAAIAVVFVTLTRNSGVLIVLPLWLMLVQQRGWNPRNWWTRGLQLAVAGLGPVVFFYHLERLWGDPLLTMRVQDHWGREQGLPWSTVAEAVHRMHRTYATGRHSCDLTVNLDSLRTCQYALDLGPASLANDLSFAFFIGGLLILPFAFGRLRVWESSYLAAGLLLPLFGPSTWDPLISISRYELVLFPIYIVVAMLLSWRPLYRVTLVVSAALMAGLVSLFISGNFIA